MFIFAKLLLSSQRRCLDDGGGEAHHAAENDLFSELMLLRGLWSLFLGSRLAGGYQYPAFGEPLRKFACINIAEHRIKDHNAATVTMALNYC